MRRMSARSRVGGGRRRDELGRLGGQVAGDHHRSAAEDPDRPFVRDPRGQHRRPGARPGRRGPGLADVPQSRLVPARGRVPVPAARRGGHPELRADGRRPRAARPAAAQGRGPADLRRDRPVQARPRPAGIHGPRPLPHQRLPDPARRRPQGDDALHPALQARPRHRRVFLSAQHAEIHRQADPAADRRALDPEQGSDQVGLLPERRRPRSSGPATATSKSASSGGTSCPSTISGSSTRSPTERFCGVGPQLPAQRVGGRLFPGPGQPRGQAARHQAAAQDGHLRHRPIRLDGRQEDRAGPQGPQVGAQQPARRRPLQHRRLRRPRRELQARAPARMARAAARRPSGSSTTSAKGEAPTSTRPSRRPWR